jgi:hypothetical protein
MATATVSALGSVLASSFLATVGPIWLPIEAPFHELMFKANHEFARIKDNYTHVLPFSFAIGYLLMVFLLPKLLKTEGKPKPPSKLLKLTMAGWNLFLSVLRYVSAVIIFLY